jgi:NADH:ubiquinone oxidoreductase subunit F (NADH-binding)
VTRALHLVGPGDLPAAHDVETVAPRTAAATSVLDTGARFSLTGSEASAGAVSQDLDRHVQAFGYRAPEPGEHGARLLRDLELIGLSGRGGGHFPAATKWRAVARAGGGGTVVVNGAESELCSAKDAALLQYRPHLVLDGAVAASEVVGAESVVVWLHEGAATSRRAVEQAMLERRAAGLREPALHLRTGPDRYLSGESSAIIQGLSGGPVLPAFHRQPTAVSGLHGRPTLLSNVETFARAALVERTGAGGYRPATLVTVVGASDRVVVDVAPAHTVADAVEVQWLGAGTPAAVLVGGYGGTWVRWDDARDLRVHEPSLRAVGHSLGAGVVVALPDSSCGIAETARIVAYLAASSARQCGPCMFGLPAIAGLVGALAAGSIGRSELGRLHRFLAEVDGRGGCRHPDGAVRLVSTALHVFEDDVRLHARRGRCQHGALGTGPVVVPVPRTG